MIAWLVKIMLVLLLTTTLVSASGWFSKKTHTDFSNGDVPNKVRNRKTNKSFWSRMWPSTKTKQQLKKEFIVQTPINVKGQFVSAWLSDCRIHEVYKVADVGNYRFRLHQALMIRSTSLNNFDNYGMNCREYRLLVNFGPVRRTDDVYFKGAESIVWMELINVKTNYIFSKYTSDWANPELTRKNLGLLRWVFDKYEDPVDRTVKFKDGLKMTLQTLKRLIWAVPLTKYKFLPSDTYMNCWRASNYFNYAFAQLQDCKESATNEYKKIWSDELVTACLSGISENLTHCTAYGPYTWTAEGKVRDQHENLQTPFNLAERNEKSKIANLHNLNQLIRDISVAAEA